MRYGRDMPWMRHRLRDTEVWARVGADGTPITDRTGRVEIVYRSEPGAKTYRASARNLTPLGGEAIEIEIAAPVAETAAAPPPENAIHVWTDGACSGNPGPAGIGVVIIDGEKRKEIGEYIGEGTNQIAELQAIFHGLTDVTERDRTVVVYSDSAYAIGLLTKPWRAKANVELVEKLRALAKQFSDLRFVKVLGHSGVAENERCDQLATSAVRMKGSSSGTGQTLRASPTAPPRRVTSRIPSAPMASPDAPPARTRTRSPFADADDDE
jgi:ribonuclease HI